jgi:hypothetical protein
MEACNPDHVISGMNPSGMSSVLVCLLKHYCSDGINTIADGTQDPSCNLPAYTATGSVPSVSYILPGTTHYATSQGPASDSSLHVTVESFQPVTEPSAREVPGGKGRPPCA